MYWDAGDGWAFKKGDYSQQTFKAEKQGDKVIVKLTSEKGKFKTENKDMDYCQSSHRPRRLPS